MNKIKKINSKVKNDFTEVIKDIIALDVTEYAIVVRATDGMVHTAYSTDNLLTLEELKNHIHIDIIDKMVQININKYLKAAEAQ